MARKVIFLDRDGTLNVDHGYVHCAEDWQWIAGAIEAMRQLQSAGYALAVVTNQSGIGEGYYQTSDVLSLHQNLQHQLAKEQITLDAIAFCPHAPAEGCRCRKPQTGLADQVAAQLGEPIDYPTSWMVGDKPSDVWFGAALEMKTVLLTSRYWSIGQPLSQPTIIGASLLETAEQIVTLSSTKNR